MLAYVYPTGNSGPIFNFKRDNWGVHLWQTAPTQEFVRFCNRALQFTNYLAVNVLKHNDWNFFGATYDYSSGIAKLWLNGAEVASQNIGVTEISTQYEARMGARVGDGRYFQGMITCMQIYNKALSASEMEQAQQMCEICPAQTTTAAPTTKNPTTAAPTTAAPTTAAPTTAVPTTKQPTTAAPPSENPITVEPTEEPTEQECELPEGLVNVASKGIASQSSKKGGGKAEKAIDGNNSSDFKQKSCSRTTLESDPWWKVDLGRSMDIYKVTITNRQDCCVCNTGVIPLIVDMFAYLPIQRTVILKILNAEVHIGDSENTGQNAMCGAKISDSGETIDVICDCGEPITGRYVSIQLLGVTEELTICEVEVMALPSSEPTEILASQNIGVTEISTQYEARMGARVGDGRYFQGMITCMQIYDKALSASEMIQAQQMCEICPEMPTEVLTPVAYWPLNAKSLTQDESGNGNDGVVTGATLDSNGAGDICSAYRFHGNANSYIEFPNNGAYDTRYSITMLAYVYPTGNSGPIFNFKRDNWGVHLWQTAPTQEFVRFCNRALQFTNYLAVNVLKHNDWNFFGATYDYSSAEEGTTIPPTLACTNPDGLVNIAVGKRASQSSTNKNGAVASRAVDGNKDSDLKAGKSCVQTNKEYQPWWKLDLGAPTDVYQVVITNRMDCCSFRMKNAEVRVGDSENFEDNPVCGMMVLGKRSRQETIIMNCGCGESLRGRYVSIQLIDKEQMLHFCEVEVMAFGQEGTFRPPPPVPTTLLVEDGTTIPPTEACINPDGLSNIAVGKIASQSSTNKNGAVASRAVDGNKNGDLKAGKSCIQTNKEFQPWWKLDLGESKDVYQVIITNRQDCCSFRLKNAEVRVGDSENFEDNPVCGMMVMGKRSRQETLIMNCGCGESMRGRYVSVQLQDKTQMLHFCEVEVMTL
uniref:Uncharacterized protein LOC100367054 n=1 Tax=Saccoglossus kowalevskii TaxID=10224 RepID=A0ABM0GMG3_SACKO|nr:PREDICTED: uncharacterized protein LOC100367054 [Saccoglossus kowalevskii]